MSFGIGSAVIGAVAGPVIGGLLGSDAAGDAADAQAQAAARTDATNRYIFDKQVELQAPFREVGLQANNRLAYLLGLGASGNGGAFTAADLVDESGGDWKPNSALYASNPAYKAAFDQFMAGHQSQFGVAPNVSRGSNLSQIEDALAKGQFGQFSLDAANQASAQGGQGGGDFGSLMRRFSMADFEADPGYAFRMKEGLAGVESGAAARGGLLSGAALKAVQKYGQGLASEEYGRAYGRFTADQTNSFNRLKSMVDTGTGANTQIGNAAQNFGSASAQTNASLGNALAAGSIGQANAWSNGIGQVSNNLMQLIQRPTTSLSGLLPTTNSYYGY